MSMPRCLALLAGCVAISIVTVAGLDGLWSGPFDGNATIFFYLVNGLLGMLGVACAAKVLRMATPSVGNRYDGAYWTIAMFAILPIVGIASLIAGGLLSGTVADVSGLHCGTAAIAVSSFTTIGLTGWLRRGAPVNSREADS